jgi:hypothetical protein
MSIEPQTPEADLHLQDEEKSDEITNKYGKGNRMPSLQRYHDLDFGL